MIKAIYRCASRALQRKALRRRIRDWGDHLERLEAQHRSHAGNVEVATAELHRAKRELAELDNLPSRVMTHAPGRTVIVTGAGREARSVNVGGGVRRGTEERAA